MAVDRFSFEHALGTIEVSIKHLGACVVVCVSGGDEPHIGSVVLAEARASLTGEGTSATSSVLNRLGHKDEFVARTVAETLAAALDTTACCICGIHKDNATPEDIQASATLGHEIASILLERLAPNSSQQ